jgi:hypothetical protein
MKRKIKIDDNFLTRSLISNPDQKSTGDNKVPSSCLQDIKHNNSTRLIWESDRVALDGIRLIEATEELLNGEVWQIDGWYNFTLHLDSWAFTQGQATGEK